MHLAGSASSSQPSLGVGGAHATAPGGDSDGFYMKIGNAGLVYSIGMRVTGDRHTGKYGPDGRLFISFRCRSPRHAAKTRPFEGDWVGWLRFFLVGVAEIADDATRTVLTQGGQPELVVLLNHAEDRTETDPLLQPLGTGHPVPGEPGAGQHRRPGGRRHGRGHRDRDEITRLGGREVVAGQGVADGSELGADPPRPTISQAQRKNFRHRATAALSSWRGTTRSSMPCSSRNSLRWKPSGSFSRRAISVLSASLVFT